MKAIFIDRDGVINKDPGGWTEYNYIINWKEFQFLPGALEALRILKEKDIKVIVISNQAGVNKGYFSQEELNQVNDRMLREVKGHGGQIEESYYCIHGDEDNCDCRKPKAGLLERAAKKYGVDFKDTYFIGDSKADVMAGKRIGCKTIVVLSGKTSREDIKEWDAKPDCIFKDLLESVRWFIKEREERK